MRIVTLIAAAAALLLTTQVALSEPTLPAGAAAREAQLLAKVGPQTRAWIQREAARQAALGTPTESGALQAVRADPALGRLSEGDIMSLAFLVLMEASKSARQDLKAIMDGVKRVNQSKAAARAAAPPRGGADVQRAAAAPGPLAAPRSTPLVQRAAIEPRPLPQAQFDAQLSRVRTDPAALNEMSEQETLRLQAAMDRQSKLMATLSNVMKKMADSGASIVQNIK